MEFIFRLEEMNADGHFTERGAYIDEGTIGFYFGLITENELPQYLHDFTELLEARCFPIAVSEYRKTLFYFPNNEYIANSIMSSYQEKTVQSHHRMTSKTNQETTPSGPQTISSEDAAELILNKKVLMFTGAGISVSSGVPDMVKLQELVDEIFSPIDLFILEVIQNKSTYRLSNAKELHGLFVLSQPSNAHLKIADLHNLYGFQLVTGNLDGLHEKTGIHPTYYTTANLVVDELESYDFIITIGLGDEGNIGLTHKFRVANPEGKVIAMNVG